MSKLNKLVGIALVTIVLFEGSARAQNWRPGSLNIAYFGEFITHPGINMGATYGIKSWERRRLKNGGVEKRTSYSLNLTPSVGFYHHKNYQTGLFAIPHLGLERKNERGRYQSVEIGAGYLGTRVPNVYMINSEGNVSKVRVGYNHFMTNYAVVFGRDLTMVKNLPVDWYVKPQLMYATPNVPKGVWYFALELGFKYTLAGAGNDKKN